MPVNILIFDVASKAPIANAKITFFNKTETFEILARELGEQAGVKNPDAPPTGTIATTGTDGKVSMKRTFDWAGNTYADGSQKNYIHPSGRILVEHPHYRSRILDMHALFPEISSASALLPINIALQKKPILPPLPETVTVAKIDFVVPDGDDAASRALSERFFNKPEERIFSEAEVTKENWREQWRVFSDALLSKAKNADLDFKSLDACLKALNYGRNLQTAAVPAPLSLLDVPLPDSATEAEIKAHEEKTKAEKVAYELAMKEREKNPERYYDESLGIIPVGAYRARYSKGDCWIIVCKWELLPSQNTETRTLGHIMVWAMDAQTAKVVAYVTCD